MTSSKDIYTEMREAELSQEQPIPSSISNEITRYIKPLHLSKAEAMDSAHAIAELVREGDANPLDVASRLRWMQDVIEQARELIRQDCVTEVGRHSGKAIINGAEIEKMETGHKYDYANCGDPVWCNYDAAEKNAKEAKKEREKFLKTIKAPMTVADELTGGEMVTLNPPIHTSTSNIKITFK